MRWVCIDQVRVIMSEDFSATMISRVIMALKLNGCSNFVELSSIRDLLQEDMDKTQIDRVIMALSTAPVPATV